MLTLFPFPRQLYSLLLLGVFDFASANKPTNITITDVSQTASNCPYSITAHFDTDLSHLELEFTSNDTYLIKLDDDPRECYTSVKYNHNGFNISLSTSSVDVRGSITLSKGVRTRIGTSISWQNDQRLVSGAIVFPIPNFSRNLPSVLRWPTTVLNSFAAKLHDPEYTRPHSSRGHIRRS